MPGVAAYAIATMDRDTLWSPAIALGVLHAWRSDLPEPGGSASFSLDAATVDACVLRLRASTREHAGLRGGAARPSDGPRF